MKLVKCIDCGDSKEILIEINSFDQEFLCKPCYNLKNSTNYFLRKQEDRESQEPSLFDQV